MLSSFFFVEQKIVHVFRVALKPSTGSSDPGLTCGWMGPDTSAIAADIYLMSALSAVSSCHKTSQQYLRKPTDLRL